MNLQYIAAIVVGIIVVMVAIVVFAPGVAEKLPGIPEASYYVKVRAKITKDILSTGIDVEIKDWEFEKKLLNIQGSGGWGILSDEKGTAVFESYAGNVLIDRTAPISWSIGRLEYDESISGTVRLGLPGSGEYRVRVIVYPKGESMQTDEVKLIVPK